MIGEQPNINYHGPEIIDENEHDDEEVELIVRQTDNQIPQDYTNPANYSPTGRRWRTTTIGIWNVRGMNALKKK